MQLHHDDLIGLVSQPWERPANVLLTGGTGFLGRNFLFWRVRMPGTIFALVRGASVEEARTRLLAAVEECAASYNLPSPARELHERVVVLLGDVTAPSCGLGEAELRALGDAGIDEVWHCAASLSFEDRFKDLIRKSNVGGTRHVLEVARQIRAGRFLHISTAYSSGATSGSIPERLHPAAQQFNNLYEETKCGGEHEVASFCEREGMRYHILRPSIILGPSGSRRSGGTRFGLYGLVRELFRLREVLAKVKGKLRLIGDPSATLNFISVDHVVFDMLHLSHTGFACATVQHLVGPDDFRIDRVMDLISRLLSLSCLELVSLRATDPTALERLFDQRFAFYATYAKTTRSFERALPTHPRLRWKDLEVFLTSYLAELKNEDASAVFTRHQIEAPDGVELCVFSLGESPGEPSKPPVLLINAYGMPADFMVPLARRLAGAHRVLCWNTRWVPALTNAFDPAAPCDSSVHVRDALTVLDHFGLGAAGLVGWSSGVQVALRAAAEHPERFPRVVLLNGTVSLAESAELRMTDFERNLRRLFPLIAKDRRLAERYVKLVFDAHAVDGEGEERRVVASVLTSTDAYLLHMTSVPFRSPESLYRYANMVASIFGERPDAWTGGVQQPVLVYGCGKDQISHPDLAAALVARLPRGELHFDDEGDHFSHFYDEAVARRIEGFFASQASASPGPGDQRQQARVLYATESR